MNMKGEKYNKILFESQIDSKEGERAEQEKSYMKAFLGAVSCPVLFFLAFYFPS